MNIQYKHHTNSDPQNIPMSIAIYTGYGEKISQGKIRNRGSEYLESEYPEVDYITDCNVMAEDQVLLPPKKNEDEESNNEHD